MNSTQVLQSIRVALGFEAEPSKFESALLKDGTEIRWEGDLSVGTSIMVVTAEGEIPAPDATHELEDGTLVTTQNGSVTEVVNPTLEQPEAMAETEDVVEETIQQPAVLEEVAAVVDQMTPEQITPEMASEIAVEVVSQIVETIDSAPEAAPVIEAMRKVKEMRKMQYAKPFPEVNEEAEALRAEIATLKDGLRKLVAVVEQFAAMPTHEPVKAPHTSSKKSSQEEQLMKFANALNNIKK